MAERFVTLLILFCSILYLVEAQDLTFGSLGSPKSGFIPILTGTLALIISLWLLASQVWSARQASADKIDWTRFIFIVIGFLFYITFLQNIGYFTATVILLFYLFKVNDTPGWLFPLLLAAGCSFGFYLLFVSYLAIPLP